MSATASLDILVGNAGVAAPPRRSGIIELKNRGAT